MGLDAGLARAGYRVVCVDQRGHGHSAHGWRPITESLLADDAIALVEKLRLGPVTLVGHSLGGQVASVVAARRPDLAKTIVLVESFFPTGAPPLGPLAPVFMLIAGIKRVFMVHFLFRLGLVGHAKVLKNFVGAQWAADPANRQARDTLLAAMLLASPLGRLTIGARFLTASGRVSPKDLEGVRVEGVVGLSDTEFTAGTWPGTVEKAEAAFPGLRVRKVEGSSHTPWAEKPDETLRAVLEAVRGADDPAVKGGCLKG